MLNVIAWPYAAFEKAALGLNGKRLVIFSLVINSSIQKLSRPYGRPFVDHRFMYLEPVLLLGTFILFCAGNRQK